MSFNYNNLFILFAIFCLSCDGILPPEGCEFGQIECDNGSCAVSEAFCDDYDGSDGIIITSPNGNNNFATGYSQPITWTASTSISKVKIYYVKGSGIEQAETAKAKVRAKVEHIYQRTFAYRKVRYRGLKKNHNTLCLLAAFYNLIRVKTILA